MSVKSVYYLTRDIGELGEVTVARYSNSQKICFFGFSDDISHLKSSFQGRKLTKRMNDEFLRIVMDNIESKFDDITELDEYLGTLDVDYTNCTKFQKKVYVALRKVRAGQTKSYSELAADIGKKNACRAVASALGKNNVSLILPCHRIIGKSGKMRGFRFGIVKKKLLLKREKGVCVSNKDPL